MSKQPPPPPPSILRNNKIPSSMNNNTNTNSSTNNTNSDVQYATEETRLLSTTTGTTNGNKNNDNNNNNNNNSTSNNRQTTILSSSSYLSYSWLKIVVYTIVGFVIGYCLSTIVPPPFTFPLPSLRHDTKNNHRTSPYKKVQTLGFQIYTGGAPAVLISNITYRDGTTVKQKQKNPECFQHERYGLLGAGPEAEFMCYVGHPNSTIDGRKRFEILQYAVEKAYKVADPDPTTLKVFLVPEFYFRGIHGAYQFTNDEEPENTTTCGPVCHILQHLETLVANASYVDWFFIFGTVVAYDTIPAIKPTTTTHNKKHDDEPFDDDPDINTTYMYYNFAPIYRGYDPASTLSKIGKHFLLPKRYTSNLDFLTPQRYINPKMTIELIDEVLPLSQATILNPFLADITHYNNTIYDLYKDELTSLGYTMIEYDWLLVDNITMTIEICLDHARKTALQSYLTDIVTGSQTRIPAIWSKQSSSSSRNTPSLSYVPIPHEQAQVSFVASAGMTISVDSLVLKQNAAIYLQDGLYNDPTQIIWKNSTSLKRQIVDETLGGFEGIERTAVVSTTDAVFEYNIIQQYQQIPVYETTTTTNSSTIQHQDNNNDTTTANETAAKTTKTSHRRITASSTKRRKSTHSSKSFTSRTHKTTSNNNNHHHEPPIPAWKIALNGTFSIERYEPMIVVWEPREIP